MLVGVWQAWLLAGLLTTAIWSVGETRVYLFTGVSGTIWAYLALRGGTITSQAGTEAYPGSQYVFAGLAILSLVGFLLCYLGDFPADDPDMERDPA